jgi:signal transduction histidine kinase
VTRKLRFGRWSSEVRIAVLLGLSVVVPCLLLAVFGLRALRTERSEAEGSLRLRLAETLRREVVRGAGRDLSLATARAARGVPLGGPADPGPALAALEEPGGLFEAAYLVTPDGRVRDSSFALVRARAGDPRLTVDEARAAALRREDAPPADLAAFAARYPLGVDEEGYPATLGFLCHRVRLLADRGDASATAALRDLDEALLAHEGYVAPARLAYFETRAERLRATLGPDRVGAERRRAKGRRLRAMDARILPLLGEHLKAGPGHEVVRDDEGDVVLLRSPVPPEGPATALLVLVLDRDVAERDVLARRLTALELPPGFRGVRAPVEASPELVLARHRTESPLEGIEVAIVAEGLDAVDAALPSGGGRYVVILVLAIVGAAAAAFVTLRTVSAELRLAKRTSDFVSNVTHELKTPLTAIRMFVETLQDDRVENEDERRECLDVIARETDRLQERIERVLKLARSSAGRSAFDLRPGNVRDALHDAAETCRARLTGRPGATLEERIDDDLGPVRFDRRALGEAVANLLSNAVKYSPADRCHLSLTGRKAGAEIVIEVRDAGFGIEEPERERIFERFYRVDEARVREVEGTGLGLALVRRIVEAHEGRISLDSVPGEGSTFRIHLPIAPPEAA